MGRITASALVVIACLFALNNVHTVMAWHVSIPFWDEWDVFPRMIAIRDAGYPIADTFNFLWEQHNEHRIVIPKLIYFADMIWFGYQGYFPLACIFLFQSLMACVLAWLFISSKRGFWKMWLFAPLTIVAAFHLVQYANFASTFQTSFVGCFAFAVIALALYAKFVVNGQKVYLIGVLLFAIFSSLSLASGLFVWLALAWLAYLLHKNSYVQSVAFIGVFVAFLLLYLHGYKNLDVQANPVYNLINHPFLIFEYWLIWLGNITETAASAKLLGSMGLLAFTMIVMHLAADKDRVNHTELYALLGICLFILMAGFVTSIGRINLGVEQAMASRYTTPVLIFWTSLLGSILLLALRIRRTLLIQIAAGLGVIFIGLLLTQHSRTENSLIAFQNRLTYAYLGVTTGIFNERPQPLLRVYPAPSLIISKIELLRSKHLSSFSASGVNFSGIGNPLASLGHEETGVCRGHVDKVSVITNNTYHVTGWAWDDASSSYPEWVYLVVSGKIIGWGKLGIQRPDVISSVPTIGALRIGWQGFAHTEGSIGQNSIEAYILSRNGAYCRL